MKIAYFSQFLAKFPPNIRWFVVYGNNENLISFREKVIIHHLKKVNPLLQVQCLEEFMIPQIPSLSLFETEPPLTLYHYRRANDRLLKEIEVIIDQNPHYYILSNPHLNTKAKLVDFALKHPSIAAIPSYTTEEAEITKVIHDFCQETSLNLPLEAKKNPF
ncbi:hypothetical protein IM40_08995 [Candidatus Paracaedimonas acanthamoebae]|nr:hypothetical protein IM40_08995 [Candidatus Paracaedimonas acanthamoebae]